MEQKPLILQRRSLLALVVVAMVILFFLVPALGRRGKVKIDLLIAPPTASVRIDNKRVGGKTVYLSPGKHTVLVNLDGFEEQAREIDVSKPEQLLVSLTPLTSEAHKIARRYESIYLELEGLAGDKALEAGESFREANAITTVLPYHGALFNIDYRLAANGEDVVVQISASSSENRAFALKRIRNWGYEPTDYEIEFTNMPEVLK